MVFTHTARQALLLHALQSYYRKHRHAPTYAELAQVIGVKQRSQVWRVVHSLVRCGALYRHETADGVIFIPADMTVQNKRVNPKLKKPHTFGYGNRASRNR